MSRVYAQLSAALKQHSVSAGLLALTACGALQKTPTGTQAQSRAEITRQAAEFDRAVVRKDASALGALLTEDFRLIRSHGEIDTKASFLNGFKSPDLTTDPYVVEDFNARLYGDSALVCGRVKMTGTSTGVPFTLTYRYVHTYIRTNDAWKVCNIQITPMS